MVVFPELISLRSVTWIQNDVASSVVQTRLVPSNLALLGQHPVLISSLVVAGPKSHGFVEVLALHGRIHALTTPRIANLKRIGTIENWFFLSGHLIVLCHLLRPRRQPLQEWTVRDRCCPGTTWKICTGGFSWASSCCWCPRSPRGRFLSSRSSTFCTRPARPLRAGWNYASGHWPPLRHL